MIWILYFLLRGSVAYYEDFEYLKEIRKIFINSTLCILGDVFLLKRIFENMYSSMILMQLFINLIILIFFILFQR